MKVAVITDDGKTISAHFGRAQGYLVFTIEDDAIVAQEQRSKAGHQQFAHEHDDEDHAHSHNHDHDQGHGFGTHAVTKHEAMIASIRDCAAVIVRGMGRGAYLAMEQANIRPIVTDLADAEAAVYAFIQGALVDHPERLH
jgi:predicted Fe-Mo cluster-binding NifX family protein